MTPKRSELLIMSLLYWALRRILELMVLLVRREEAKEVEILACATSSPCSVARSPGLSWGSPIGRCWPGSRGPCRGGAGRRSSCGPRRCSAGTGGSSPAAGPTAGSGDGRAGAMGYATRLSGSPRRTTPGGYRRIAGELRGRPSIERRDLLGGLIHEYD